VVVKLLVPHHMDFPVIDLSTLVDLAAWPLRLVSIPALRPARDSPNSFGEHLTLALDCQDSSVIMHVWHFTMHEAERLCSFRAPRLLSFKLEDRNVFRPKVAAMEEFGRFLLVSKFQLSLSNGLSLWFRVLEGRISRPAPNWEGTGR
jgi:hypothetical protein